jgi:hypothetical protein
LACTKLKRRGGGERRWGGGGLELRVDAVVLLLEVRNVFCAERGDVVDLKALDQSRFGHDLQHLKGGGGQKWGEGEGQGSLL